MIKEYTQEDVSLALKRINKTENVLRALLMVMHNLQAVDTSMPSNNTKDLVGMRSLIIKTEDIVYEAMSSYHDDNNKTKNNLAKLVFMVETFKIKGAISNEIHEGLVTAYRTIINSYETLSDSIAAEDSANRSIIKDVSLSLRDLEEADDLKIDVAQSGPMPNALKLTERPKETEDTVIRIGYSKKEADGSQGAQIKKDNEANLKRQDSRRQEILRVLTSEPVSIKDISLRVLGCSEKTIQRELNNLLEDKKILRIGDKRWSRYAISASGR